MSQADIIFVLEKYKRPMSRTEIAKELEKDLVLIAHNIAACVKSHEVKVIEIDREQAMKVYNCKRRMRLYYV